MLPYLSADYNVRRFDLQDGKNLLDRPALENACVGCDAVVHLAAIARPLEGWSFDAYFRTNVLGTIQLAETATAAGVRRLIHASSMAVFGLESGVRLPSVISDQTPPPIWRLPPDAIECTPAELAYQASKVMAEQALAWFGLTRRLEVACLRFGPIDVDHLGFTLRMEDACRAITAALIAPRVTTFHTAIVAAPGARLDLSAAERLLDLNVMSESGV